MIARWFVRVTAPVVRRIARAYGLRLDHPCVALGENPLVIGGDPASTRGNIPASVMFNTRSGAIRVGPDTVFGEEVMVLTGKHFDIEAASAAGVPHQHVPSAGRDITIGRGCYIGSRAILIGPLAIGDYAVIGAGAVVTRDVAPRTMVAGVPARLVRVLSDPDDPSGRGGVTAVSHVER